MPATATVLGPGTNQPGRGTDQRESGACGSSTVIRNDAPWRPGSRARPLPEFRTLAGAWGSGIGPAPGGPPEVPEDSLSRSRKLTEKQREQRRQADRDRLATAARELLTSEGWARWVRFRSSVGLGRYSPRNQWLIMLTDAAPVAAGSRA